MAEVGGVSDDEIDKNAWFEEGIVSILNGDKVTRKHFMDLYTYNFGRPESTRGVKRSIGPDGNNIIVWEKNQAATNLTQVQEVVSSLSNPLQKYLDTLMKEFDSRSPEDSLRFYSKIWAQFSLSLRLIDAIYGRQNRQIIKCIVAGICKEYGLIFSNDLALSMWKEGIVDKNHPQLIKGFLKTLNSERDGEIINEDLLKSFSNSLLKIGSVKEEFKSKAKSAQNPEASLQALLKPYQETLEAHFLQDSEKYYETFHQKLVENKHEQSFTPQYIAIIKKQIDEENRRCSKYMHATTTPKLVSILEKILIVDELQMFYDYFNKLFMDEDDNFVAYENVYDILSPLEGAVVQFTKIYKEAIVRQGKKEIEKVFSSQPKEQLHPNLYFQTVNKIYEKFENISKISFKNDWSGGFIRSLNSGYTALLNDNFITVNYGTGKSAELLARYLDAVLRNSLKKLSETEMEQRITKVMKLHKFLNDKDLFYEHVSVRFAIRLITASAYSNETEEFLFSKIKEENMIYANKIRKMIIDQKCSVDFNKNFNEWLVANNKELAFSVDFLICTPGIWSLKSADDSYSNFVYPEELLKGIEMYKEFYGSVNKYRLLNILPAKSRGDVSGTFNEKTYTFQCSTFQIAILLLFNESDSFALGDILERVQIPQESLFQLIGILTKVTLLKEENVTNYNENETENKLKTVVSLNKDYAGERVHVNLIQNVQRETSIKKENASTEASVTKWREVRVQAVIVRIMKTRKEMRKQELIAQVMTQIAGLFEPNVQLIQRGIDVVVQNNYIERAAEDNDLYKYIS